LDPSDLQRFERVVLPHLDAAYTLARYLTGDEHDAEDIVQEACLRALKYFGGFRGTDEANARAWLLTIVRNAAYTARRRRSGEPLATEFDESVHSEAVADETPETALLRGDQRDALSRALNALAPAYREVIVLREVQGLSYKEISDVAGVPVGTVMSRLSRARANLQASMREDQEK